MSSFKKQTEDFLVEETKNCSLHYRKKTTKSISQKTYITTDVGELKWLVAGTVHEFYD